MELSINQIKDWSYRLLFVDKAVIMLHVPTFLVVITLELNTRHMLRILLPNNIPLPG